MAPTPVRIERAEELLEAQSPSLEIFEKAADIVADACILKREVRYVGDRVAAVATAYWRC